jgi:hypothetical protein
MAAGGARARQRAGRDQRSGSTGRTLAAAGVYARSVSFSLPIWRLHRPLFFILGEDEQQWTARRGWTNPDGHRQKGDRPEAALSLGRKRPRRAYTGVNRHRNNAGFGRRWPRRHEPSASVPSMLCSPYGRPSAHLLLVAPLPLKERPVVHAFHQTRRRRTSGPSALRCVIIRPVWRRPSPGDPPCPPPRPAPLS